MGLQAQSHEDQKAIMSTNAKALSGKVAFVAGASLTTDGGFAA